MAALRRETEERRLARMTVNAATCATTCVRA
jgi:hypothetical protein